MRWLLVLLVACGGDNPGPVPPKRPNNELILGEFERRQPGVSTAMRFRADGSVTVAHDKSKLDGDTLATGTFDLDKDHLTLAYTRGMCAGTKGTYQVVISKVGIHFKKLDDGCDQRAKIDGETWWRIR